MSFKLFWVALFLTTAVFGYGQKPQTKPIPPESTALTQKQTGEPKENLSAGSFDDTKTLSNPAQQTTYVRPDAKQRFNRYVNSVVGPFAIARNVSVAGISTWRNSPEEWGTKWEGFGRRVASNFGISTIKETATYALDESFKLDSRFYKSRKRDFGSKLRNGLISPVTTRTSSGKRIFGFPRVVGAYASNVIAAEAWFPDRFNYKDGLRSGTISLGFDAVFFVVKEFVFKK